MSEGMKKFVRNVVIAAAIAAVAAAADSVSSTGVGGEESAVIAGMLSLIVSYLRALQPVVDAPTEGGEDASTGS